MCSVFFFQRKVQCDAEVQTRTEADILEMLQRDGQAFGEPQTQGLVP